MIEPFAISCEGTVADALARMGRTEDIAVSPDGRRIALAGFSTHVILVLEVDVDAGRRMVAVPRVVTVRCTEFKAPHGVAFAGDHLLVVANREGSVLVVECPPPGGADVVDVHPALDLARAGSIPFAQPGSVAVIDSDLGLSEILVCHNDAATVSRHLLDRCGATIALVGEERLLHAGLAVPDSAAMSADGRWLAVSNHFTHEVLIYENGPTLGPDSEPVGHLDGVLYPHGLAFTAGDTVLLVTDAGRPYVHVFEGDDGWTGARSPVRAVRVKSDEDFERTHYNAREGGPKGLDIHHDLRIVAITSELQPLAMYSLDQWVDTSKLTAEARGRREDPHGRRIALRAITGLAEAERRAVELERLLTLVLESRRQGRG